MAPTVADYLLERLRDWEVEHVFAFPGDGINGILAAWGRADNKPQFVQARHEEMAAFEAVGYAKFSGRVGVCMATSLNSESRSTSCWYEPPMALRLVWPTIATTGTWSSLASYRPLSR